MFVFMAIRSPLPCIPKKPSQIGTSTLLRLPSHAERMVGNFPPLLRLLNQFSATLYTGTIIHLELNVNLREDLEEDSQIRGEDDVEWLGFLHQFPGMRVLHVESRVLARRIAYELEEITVEMVAEVLPFLELVYLEGQPASSVEKFVTARRSTNYPTTVVNTMEEFNKRLESNARK